MQTTKMRYLCAAAFVVVAVTAPASALSEAPNEARGTGAVAGLPPADPLETVPITRVQFGTPDVPPIPANFFGPGSQPFFGIVQMQGGQNNPENAAVSTTIQRHFPVSCPGTGFPRPCDPMPIEIVSLDLASINPITVNGPVPPTWNVEVSLSLLPSPLGGLAANLEHANGGGYNCFLPVLPRFTFTNVDDPGDVRSFDYGEEGIPPIQLFFNASWVSTLAPHLVGTIVAPSDGNFVPGVQQDPDDPASQFILPAVGNSSNNGVIHTVEPPPPPPPPDPHRTFGPTFADFGAPDVPPIPADFFYSGSDSFEGTIQFKGGRQDSQDTIVQRGAAVDPMQPNNIIPLEIVSLDLVSIQPISVTGSQDSLWDVTLSLCSEPGCNKNGQDDTIDLSTGQPNGGTFDATITITPKFTFTRIDDPLQVKVLDFGVEGIPPVQLMFNDVPWVSDLAPHLDGVIEAPSDGNFVPGVFEQIPGQPPTQVVVQVSGNSQGGGVTHTIGPPVGPRFIPAGVDCWVTECGSTNYDFSSTPIPVGFFDVEGDDNTLAFADVVLMEGATDGSDTQVRRCNDVLFPPIIPSPAVVPIELVALDLRGCAPVVIEDCCKPAELWIVEVMLSPTAPPACSALMSLTKTHANGGTFDSQFPVQPLFRFTRISDSTVRVFDTALEGFPPENLISSAPVPWVHRLYDQETETCGIAFAPGIEEMIPPLAFAGPGGPTYPQCCDVPCHGNPFGGGASLHCTGPIDCSACPGACCDPLDGSCSYVTESNCTTVFKGIRTNCDDSDGDGLADDIESGTCCGPRNNCNTGTDPFNPDTDGDGVSDNAEVTNGTDGCDPCDPSAMNLACPVGGTDCNNNSTLDICDIAAGTSTDCDENSIPDECQPDCDGDNCANACELICGTQVDANMNGVPDDCKGGIPLRPRAENGATQLNLGTATVASCMTDADCRVAPQGVNAQIHCIANDSGGFPGTCYVSKGRYISIAPNPANAGQLTARRVSKDINGNGTFEPGTDLVLGWVAVPLLSRNATGEPAPQKQALINPVAVPPPAYYIDWTVQGPFATNIVHVGDGEICPGRTYLVQEIAVGQDVTIEANYSAATRLPTVTRWGDVIGSGPGLAPQNSAAFSDALACIQGFSAAQTVSKVWLDMEPVSPNFAAVGFGDALRITQGIVSQPYPFAGCP